MNKRRNKRLADNQYEQTTQEKWHQSEKTTANNDLQNTSFASPILLSRKVQNNIVLSGMSPLMADQVLALQDTLGNQYTQRLVEANLKMNDGDLRKQSKSIRAEYATRNLSSSHTRRLSSTPMSLQRQNHQANVRPLDEEAEVRHIRDHRPSRRVWYGVGPPPREMAERDVSQNYSTIETGTFSERVGQSNFYREYGYKVFEVIEGFDPLEVFGTLRALFGEYRFAQYTPRAQSFLSSREEPGPKRFFAIYLGDFNNPLSMREVYQGDLEAASRPEIRGIVGGEAQIEEARRELDRMFEDALTIWEGSTRDALMDYMDRVEPNNPDRLGFILHLIGNMLWAYAGFVPYLREVVSVVGFVQSIVPPIHNDDYATGAKALADRRLRDSLRESKTRLRNRRDTVLTTAWAKINTLRVTGNDQKKRILYQHMFEPNMIPRDLNNIEHTIHDETLRELTQG